MRVPRIPLFRIWYSTTYTVLFLILLILLAATPADHIYQSTRHGVTLRNIVVVGSVYVLTVLLAIFIYANRLYTTRSVLQAIPKAYIPVEPGEVKRNVRRMIVKALRRSALVAWDARPRDIRPELHEHAGGRPSTAERKSHQRLVRRRPHGKGATVIPISPDAPPWGQIAHRGWSSPASETLPSLQYLSVLLELPNLIEAKAVSLAPPDPWLGVIGQGEYAQVVPDARLVAVLQRPPTMGLRDYMAHLTSVGVIKPPELAPEFLSQYEYARFSTSPLTEDEFQNLMDTFGQILSSMTELDMALLEEGQGTDEGLSESSSLAPSENTSAIHYYTPRVLRAESPRTHRTMSSTSRGISPVTARTAPSTRYAASSAHLDEPTTPSSASMSSVRIHPLVRTHSGAVSSSSSSTSRSGGSVIRLAQPGDHTALPYHINPNGG